MADYGAIADKYETKYSIPKGMLHRLVGAESSGDPNALSPKGAGGLAQLMPGTAKEMGVTDVNDPEQNIGGGAKYLRQMYDRFKSWPLALAAYNAGPTKVQQAGGIPDIPGVSDYVSKIMATSPTAAIPTNSRSALSQVLNDPQVAALNKTIAERTAQADKSYADARTRVMANQDKTKSIIAQPLPPKPEQAVLHDVTEFKAPKETNPLQVFGQFMPMLAILGSGMGRAGALGALKSATAAMKAVKSNNAEELQKAHEDWKDKTEFALRNNQIEHDRYQMALNDHNMTMNERVAELRAIAADSQDAMMLGTLDSGQVDEAIKLLGLREAALKKNWDMYDDVDARDIQRGTLQLAQNKQTFVEQSAGNKLEAQYAALVAKEAGGIALTAAEKQSMKDIQEFRRANPMAGLFGNSSQADTNKPTTGTPTETAIKDLQKSHPGSTVGQLSDGRWVLRVPNKPVQEIEWAPEDLMAQ